MNFNGLAEKTSITVLFIPKIEKTKFNPCSSNIELGYRLNTDLKI